MSTLAPLTHRQRAILTFVERRIAERGQSPTVREIGSEFRIASTNGVRSHLMALVKKGYLKHQEYLSRGISLTRSLGAGGKRVPIVGMVPAGLPIDAVENVEGELSLDRTYLGRGDTYCLRIVGMSMKDAGILDGDMVIVQKQASAEAGEIVVAVVNGEATVKRYLPQARGVMLEPANPDFQPIMVSPSSRDFRLAGKVIGLVRRLA